jgi:hypothetical protein
VEVYVLQRLSRFGVTRTHWNTVELNDPPGMNTLHHNDFHASDKAQLASADNVHGVVCCDASPWLRA